MNDASVTSHQDGDGLDGVRFGRNRFLTLLGGTLVGLSVRAFVPESARANHEPPLAPCSGWGRCHYCCGTYSNPQPCSGYIKDYGCLNDSTRYCWTSCVGGVKYKCCDFRCNSCDHSCSCRYACASCC
jgi:hypothetical protein